MPPSKRTLRKNNSVFKIYVEVGRVGYINCGEEFGKICTIVDIIDQNRVLIDGPFHTTGITRREENLKHLNLTNIVVSGLKRGSNSKELKEAVMKQKIQEKWQQSRTHQKLAQRDKRQHLNDFLRLKARILKKQKNSIIQQEFSTLKEKDEEKHKKRMEPHLQLLKKIKKRKTLFLKKSFSKLARKIMKKNKGKNPKKVEEKINNWKKAHPNQELTQKKTKKNSRKKEKNS